MVDLKNTTIPEILDPDEKILWQKITGKGRKRELHQVVTNKRVYKRHPDVPFEDFSSAPKRFIRREGIILIVERVGIDRMKKVPAKSTMEKVVIWAKRIKWAIENGKEKFDHVKQQVDNITEQVQSGQLPSISSSGNSVNTQQIAVLICPCPLSSLNKLYFL